MKEEKKKLFSKKQVLGMLILGLVVLGGSGFAILSMFPEKIQAPVSENTHQFGQLSASSEEAINYFGGVPLDCYVEYTNPPSKLSASVTLYNETLSALEKAHKTNRNQTLSYIFKNPYAEMYLLQACEFFNNTSTPTPKEFNASKGTDQPPNVKSQIISYMNQVMENQMNFTQFAETNSIESIANFYQIGYASVVDMLVERHIIDVSRDCHQMMTYQGIKAPSGIVECNWNTSDFMYKINNTGSAQRLISEPQS